MAKIVRLTESDLTRIVKRVIKESSQQEANQLAKIAMSNSQNPENKGIKNEITKCIKENSFSHLMVLTTGVGSAALGALAALFASGVGTLPALILMAAGAIITTIEGMMTTSGSGAGSVSDELEQLYNCLKNKKVI